MTTGRRRLWVALAVVSILVHLGSLYWPTAAVPQPVPESDKVAHVLLFAAPTYLVGRLVPPIWPAAVFALHAPLSELAQHWWMPDRSGDLLDVVADLMGVGLAVAVLVVRRRRSR